MGGRIKGEDSDGGSSREGEGTSPDFGTGLSDASCGLT